MSIFDFLFAKAATPEQAQKNIFLDAIDGGGRFDSGEDFRGGPLGISALLNALGVDPYGYTDAQPSSPPARTAPVSKPAQTGAPRPAATPDLVDFIAANTGLRPSTDAELTAALEQPTPGSLIGRPFDGAGFGYTAPPPAPPMGTTFGNLGNPIDETALNLLAPQVVQEVTAAQPVDYYSIALRNPDFLPWLNKNYPGYLESIRANSVTAAEKELVARQFMAVPANPRPAQAINGMPIITQKPSPPPESAASSVSASPLAMSAAPAALSSSPIGTSGSLPVLSNDGTTNIPTLYETAGSQQYSMPTVPNDAPTSDNPNLHPESEIQRVMSQYNFSRQGAIGALDISLRAYLAQKEMMEATQ